MITQPVQFVPLVDDYAEFKDQETLIISRAKLANEEELLRQFSRRIFAMIRHTNEMVSHVDCRIDPIPH